MKPEPYLSKRGKALFKIIAQHLEDKGLSEDVYSIMLSSLCQSISVAEDAAQHINNGEAIQIANSGYAQVGPYHTIHKNALADVIKMLPKFGITPQDLERLKTKAPKAGKLDAFKK